ncbi:hypothetical protein ABIE65_001878 [Constrictibacter sp. MBR-5]|uniref:hypothetical protein n=1 Tax=Constrictibacter sp. MBR-5 TaxID=3156467 RepID=UPI003395E5D6
MTSAVGKFGVQFDASGVHVTAVGGALCPGCLSDEQVDEQIQWLKDDLDIIAMMMKNVIVERRGKPLGLKTREVDTL